MVYLNKSNPEKGIFATSGIIYINCFNGLKLALKILLTNSISQLNLKFHLKPQNYGKAIKSFYTNEFSRKIAKISMESSLSRKFTKLLA